ncbi:MAG: hypothetical protein JNK58_01940 [Phycisphaerae bacterium]|nr:hypothetical protein [Phycisphaerae bacterium]
MKMRLRSLRALTFKLAMCLTGSVAFGQVAGPTWVAFDTQPAGTPPSIVADRLNTNEDQSAFNITFHGFYHEPVTIPGVGNFRRVFLELHRNNRSTMTAGRPQLPVIPLKIAIPTNAPALGTPQVSILASTQLTAFDVRPAQPDYIEEEGVLPSPPAPSYDAAFYAASSVFPAADAEVLGTPESMYRVRTQCVQVNPFRANPGQRTLTINRSMRVIIPHNGNASPPVEITRRTERLLSAAVDNWTSVAGGYTFTNQGEYKGEYLCIGPSAFVNDPVFTPFAQQKAERGYKVTVRTTEFVGSTATAIYNAIGSWYGSRPAGADCYVLLVGDTDAIPMGLSPRHGTNVSDYVYSCHPVGMESNPELYIGRFSVSNLTELGRIVTRSIAYQDTPSSSTRYDNVLLAAHRQLENGYVQCVEDIANYGSYNGVQPQFSLRRGSQSTGTVANVYSDTASGQGVILYRGHGGGTSWSHWDFNSASLASSDVTAMSLNFVRPVVFSVACTNSQIDRADEPCISEVWHRKSGGAVAHLGGSRSTWTYANHTFAKNLMFWLYFPSQGLTLGSIIDISGLFTAVIHDGCGWDNRYLYLLQGDPEMVVWRENPVTTFISWGSLRGVLPEWLYPGQQTLSLTFTQSGGTPIEGAIVAAYKEGEVQSNAYTDAQGNVSLSIDPATCGDLVIRAYSDFQPIREQRLVIPVAILGDADHDHDVDFTDITAVLTFWNSVYLSVLGQGDADFSKNVNFADVTAVLRSWGSRCD